MADNETTSTENIGEMWETLSDAMKSRALKTIYEEQQKTVINLQRTIMDKGGEIAVAIAKAKAADELHEEELLKQTIEGEVVPLRKEFEEMEKRLAFERKLLDEYLNLGKGYI